MAEARTAASTISNQEDAGDGSSGVDVNELPSSNRAGATFDDSGIPPKSHVKPSADEEYNYSILCRWRHRLKLWEHYMESDSARKYEFPKMEDFLFSEFIAEDNCQTQDSVKHLIWGKKNDGESFSVQSLCEELKSIRSELSSMSDDDFCPVLLQSYHEELAILETFKVPSHLIISSEHLAFFQDQLDKERNRRVKQLTKYRKLKERKEILKEKEKLLKLCTELIKVSIGNLCARHEYIRTILCALAGKGNETTGSGSCSASLDSNRFDKPPRVLSTLDEIFYSTPDGNLLAEMLARPDILRHKDHLLELQNFVAAILQGAEVTSDTTKIKATVDAILNWNPGTTVNSLGSLRETFACPPPNGSKTNADQPILSALIFRVLSILGHELSAASGQVMAPVGDKPGARRIDFNDHDSRDYLHILHVLYPQMLEHAVNVKTASHDNSVIFRKNQRKGRDQVIGHLAKRLIFAFDFGGIGLDEAVCGVVLTRLSIQVLVMELKGVGAKVDIVFRQTAHVPLFGEVLPIKIRESVLWEENCNGVLLLASALLDLHRSSMFDRVGVQSIQDVSAADHNQIKNHSNHHVDMKIEALLGSGGFCHTVKLGNDEFMKVPRSRCMVKSLERECEMIGKLMAENASPHIFPECCPWGVSIINLSIRGEISQIKGLRLRGILGGSLSNCKPLNMDVAAVIKKVYDALSYAHLKKVYHMDVRPGNIIIASNGKGYDVMLADWGCSLSSIERIEPHRFVGCAPYAHDKLLGARTIALQPSANFDFASLGYTWYHVTIGMIDWQFDHPNFVTDQELRDRRGKMESFFNNMADTRSLVPKVHELFVPHCGKRPRGSDSA